MHPIHPAMTSLPLGMVEGALVFALVGLGFTPYEITVAVHHCIILALVGGFPIVLPGCMDWVHYYGGAWLVPLKLKIIPATSLIVLLSFSVWFQARVGGDGLSEPWRSL
jgi:hypothetical protein